MNALITETRQESAAYRMANYRGLTLLKVRNSLRNQHGRNYSLGINDADKFFSFYGDGPGATALAAAVECGLFTHMALGEVADVLDPQA